MKLDDRPVIDQLLNPTPLNHLYEVQDEMFDWALLLEEEFGYEWTNGASDMLKMVEDEMEARL